MSFDTLIQLILALFTGTGDQVAAVAADPRVLLVSFGVTLSSIAVVLVKHKRYLSGLVTLAVAAGLAAAFVVRQQSRFDLHAGRVFIGGDLDQAGGRGGATTLDGCQQRCLADSRCAAFTFDQVAGACYLKTQIGSMHALPHAISGIRRRPADDRR